MLLLGLTLAGMSACFEHGGEGMQPEDVYLSRLTIERFELVQVYSPGDAHGYYFGPSSFDPLRDIKGPITLSVPASKDASDAMYETVADGHGVTGNGIKEGIPCYITVSKSKPGGPQSPYWVNELSAEQARLVREGSHVVVDIGVLCD